MLLTDIATRFRKGLFIGVIASAAAFPYLYFQTLGPWAKPISRDWSPNISPAVILYYQFSLLVAAVLISAVIGTFLSEKYSLPDIGADRDETLLFLKRWSGWAIIGGLIFGWLMHDRTFYIVVPTLGGLDMYPRNIPMSAMLILHNAVMKEVVLRYGMVTLAVGLFGKNRSDFAVVITSLIAPLFAFRQLMFVEYPALDVLSFLSMIWTLALNLALGLIYVRKGLAATMSMRACIDFRFIVYQILGAV